MLNNIKVIQKSEEIVLNINIMAEINEILEELSVKLPKLKEFYKTSKLPMRVTGKLFSENETEIIKNMIQDELKIKVKFDEVSDLLGLHAIKKTFQANTEISETKYITNSIRSGQKEEYPGSIVVCGDVNPRRRSSCWWKCYSSRLTKRFSTCWSKWKYAGYNIS